MKKDLTSKFKEKIKTFAKSKIAKPVLYTLVAGASILYSGKAKAQDIYQNPEVKSAMNMYSQPNLHTQFGKATYEYYGSSDVNLDGIAGNEADAQAIDDGVVNDMADVNGDGAVNYLDAQKIRSGEVLPGRDFNHLNGNQKIDWIKKCLRIDDSDMPYNNWISPDGDYENCHDFTSRGGIHFRGSGDSESHDNPYINHDPTAVARFNLPAYYGSTKIQFDGTPTASGHALLAFYIGDRDTPYEGDPTKLDNYVVFDIQNRHDDTEVEEIQPGSERMKEYFNISYQPKINGYMGSPILNFDFGENILSSPEDYTVEVDAFYEDYLLMQNPNKPAPTITFSNMPNDTLVNYLSGQTFPVSQFGQPAATASDGSEVTLSIEDSERIPTNASYPNIEFYFNRAHIATTATGGADTLYQRIESKDSEKPYFTKPADITVKEGEENDLSISGEPTNVNDNSGYTNVSYSDYIIYEDDARKDIERTWTVSDPFANDSIDVQHIQVDAPSGIKDIEGTNKPCDLEATYPNPFTDNAIILYATKNPGLVSFKITNISGQNLRIIRKDASYGNNKFACNLSDLPNGMYFISAEGCPDKAEMIVKK